MTRTSEVVLEARSYALLQNAMERYCTINCGLNPVRNNKQASRLREPALQPIFQRIAKCLGIYRHVVSLVANQIVIDDHLAANCDWKTFYDRIWSAVEAVIDDRVKDTHSNTTNSSTVQKRSQSNLTRKRDVRPATAGGSSTCNANKGAHKTVPRQADKSPFSSNCGHATTFEMELD